LALYPCVDSILHSLRGSTNSPSVAEEQGVLDPRRPDYLDSKSEVAADEELGLPAVPKSDNMEGKVAVSDDKDGSQKA
jgi:hypothetical protein